MLSSASRCICSRNGALRGRALRIPVRQSLSTAHQIVEPLHRPSMWRRLGTIPKRRPLCFAVWLNSVLCMAADLNAQSLEGNSVDPKRVFVFGAFGAFQGVSTYAVYMRLFSRICPGTGLFSALTWREKLRSRSGQIEVLKQVVLDNLVYTPIWYFPVFHAFKANLDNQGSQDLQTTMFRSCSKYQDSFLDDNMYSCAVWVPADILVFSVPSWLRMPISNAVNFGWTTFVSWRANATQQIPSTACSEQSAVAWSVNVFSQ